jgi:beta-mannosidase
MLPHFPPLRLAQYPRGGFAMPRFLHLLNTALSLTPIRNAGRDFEAGLWIVNDLQESLTGLTFAWTITNARGEVRLQDRFTVDVAPDSSSDLGRVQWKVEGTDNETFTVAMKLSTPDGKVLGENHHTLLVGDQELAKAYCAEMHAKVTAQANAYGKGYYRYFPELWEFE